MTATERENPMPLPTWNQMSDLDKGCALLHAWKCYWEHSTDYAVENYPAEYRDHPALVELDAESASRHAREVTGGWGRVTDDLGVEEVERLYNLALAADRAARK